MPLAGAEVCLKRVLIADNDASVSGLLAEVLRRHGLDVTVAGDGDAAMAAAIGQPVAVLVCDLDMPRLSGVEVLENLAVAGWLPPSLVISGFLESATLARLRRIPAVREVLRKPFDLLAFARRVQELAAATEVVSGGPER